MLNKLLIFLFIGCFVLSCKEEKYTPEGLTKLSEEELIERFRNKNFNLEKTVVKNEQGEILTEDSIRTLPNPTNLTADLYVDEHGEVQEMIFREALPKDRELRKKLAEAFKYQPPLEVIDINCAQKCEILQKVFESDQGMRTNGSEIHPEVDRKNLSTVVSLIEKCGMPTLDEVDDVQMNAIWLVFQHGDNPTRKKYLPLLEKAARQGDLKATSIAMMKDRVLMEDGKPQIYGTQVTMKNGTWELYELEHPETVNKRRAEIGFGPIQEYLQRWDIEFNITQLE